MRTSQPWRTNRSRVLRGNETSAEEKLWSELRNRRFARLKFLRQAPVGPYFVDFLCRERKIVVEVDGCTHGSDAEITADAAREALLQGLGYRIFCVWNGEIYDNMDGVLEALLVFAEEGS